MYVYNEIGIKKEYNNNIELSFFGRGWISKVLLTEL